jgi:hypothetical protein
VQVGPDQVQRGDERAQGHDEQGAAQREDVPPQALGDAVGPRGRQAGDAAFLCSLSTE